MKPQQGLDEEYIKDALELMEEERECDHEGWVHKGVCERCGERDLWSDADIYRRENAW